MRVGIPRCLSFYYLFPLYRTFLDELGVPFVETSPSTLKDLENLGLCPTDEPCVSVKVVFPHAAKLLEQGVDALFIPTIVSLEKESFCCPKMMGLPSMIKSGFELSDSQIISPVIDVRDNPRRWPRTWIRAGKQMGIDDSRRIQRAFDKAWNTWKDTERMMSQFGLPVANVIDSYYTGETREQVIDRYGLVSCGANLGDRQGLPAIDRIESDEPITAVMGHSYILNDIFGQVILKYASTHGPVILPEMVPEEYGRQALASIFEGEKMWTIEGHILGGCLHLIRNHKVDRIILVTSFSCGPLSIIENYIEKEADEYGIPLLYLAVDEHTGEAGLITRMEAFMDACKSRHREQLSDIPVAIAGPTSSVDCHEETAPLVVPVARNDRVGVVNMGHLDVAVGTVFEKLGVNAKIADPLSDDVVNLGRELAPEFICYPMVTLLGQIRSLLHEGISRIVMIQGKGKCRLGWYAQIMEELLLRAGYDVKIYKVDSPFPLQEKLIPLLAELKEIFGSPKVGDVINALVLALKKMFFTDEANDILFEVRAKEKVRGSGDKIYNRFIRRMEKAESLSELKALFKEYKRQMDSVSLGDVEPLKVMIVGEIYVINEPFVTKEIERMLGSLEQRVRVYKNLDVSSWVKTHLLFMPDALLKHRRVVKAASSYLPVGVGGHGLESIGETVLAKKAGMDGVVHLFPFTCMPEIIAQNILVQVSEDLDMPVLSLMISEQTGVAGLKTRVEAFCDVLYGRNKKPMSLQIAM
ncbi:MAG: acyl-CoA dehydratase activase-related protein [Bacillota bacterium]